MTLESQQKICKRCGQPIPANLLDCPVCLAQIQRAASLKIQRRYLASVLDNRMALILGHSKYKATCIKWHIQFFEDPGHSYCGEPLNEGKRSYTRYNQIPTTEQLCSRCVAALQALIEEGKPCHSD